MTGTTLYISIDGGVKDGDLIYNQPLKPDTVLTIGRSTQADIQIPLEYDVAGLEHCRLKSTADGIVLERLPLQSVRLDQQWIEEDDSSSTSLHALFEKKRTHDLELGSAFRGDSTESGFSPFRLRLGLSNRVVKPSNLLPTTQNSDSAKRSARSRFRTVVSNFVSLATLAGIGLAVCLSALTLFGQFQDRLRDVRFQDEVLAQVEDISNIRIGLSATHASPPWVTENDDAIWLIGTLNETDTADFRGYGTAWVYQSSDQRPVLITNRHVIDQLSFDFSDPRRQPYIRRSIDGEPVSLALNWDSVTFHEHHADLDNFFVNKANLKKANVFDLAAIQLAEESNDPLLSGAALSLSSSSDTEVGDFVGYIGYPFENLGSGGYQAKNPVPIFVKGTVGRVTDLFGLATEDEIHRNLILVDITAMGGASGSPLFNSRGEVIGIISSGDVLLIDASSINENPNPSNRDSVRVPIGFTNAYGVDLVKELVDAPSSLPDREPYWRRTQAEIGDELQLPEAQLARFRARLCKHREIETRTLPPQNLPGLTEVWPAMATIHLDSVENFPTGDVLFSAVSESDKSVGLGVSQAGAKTQAPPSVGIESFAVVKSQLNNPKNARVEISGSPNDTIQVTIDYCSPEN